MASCGDNSLHVQFSELWRLQEFVFLLWRVWLQRRCLPRERSEYKSFIEQNLSNGHQQTLFTVQRSQATCHSYQNPRPQHRVQHYKILMWIDHKVSSMRRRMCWAYNGCQQSISQNQVSSSVCAWVIVSFHDCLINVARLESPRLFQTGNSRRVLHS